MLHIRESISINVPQLAPSLLARVSEALLPAGGSQALEVKIAAIHEGLTRNNTFYTKDGLTNKERNPQGQVGGLESWTKPYQAPILKDHDASVDNTIGRVTRAEWVDKGAGEPGHVEITTQITNPEAIEKFVRGEYNTGSIGMDVDHANCSVCGTDFMKGWRSACEHEKGKWYKRDTEAADRAWVEAEPHEKGARRMHIAMGNVWAREYSVVAIPSDAKSRVKSFDLKEMTLSGQEGETLNLLEPAAVVENEDEPVVTDPKTRPIAELLPLVGDEIQVDPTGLYFTLITQSEKELVSYKTESLAKDEVAALLTYIRTTNEDIEDEFALIDEAVLSTERAQALPDSSFAVLRTAESGAITGRLFPFRDEKQVVRPDQLATALVWIRSLEHLPWADRQKAQRRLVAAARKAKLGEVDRSVEIEAAKALLAQEGLETLPVAELATLRALPTSLDTDLTEQIEALTLELEDANLLILERETEVEELHEQVASIETAREALTAAILTAVDDDEQEARKTELAAQEVAQLITELIKAAETLRAQPAAPATGLSLGSDPEASPVSDTEVLTDVFMAKFGSRHAQHKVFSS